MDLFFTFSNSLIIGMIHMNDDDDTLNDDVILLIMMMLSRMKTILLV